MTAHHRAALEWNLNILLIVQVPIPMRWIHLLNKQTKWRKIESRNLFLKYLMLDAFKSSRQFNFLECSAFACELAIFKPHTKNLKFYGCSFKKILLIFGGFCSSMLKTIIIDCKWPQKLQKTHFLADSTRKEFRKRLWKIYRESQK